jgi:hypothetical protein
VTPPPPRTTDHQPCPYPQAQSPTTTDTTMVTVTQRESQWVDIIRCADIILLVDIGRWTAFIIWVDIILWGQYGSILSVLSLPNLASLALALPSPPSSFPFFPRIQSPVEHRLLCYVGGLDRCLVSLSCVQTTYPATSTTIIHQDLEIRPSERKVA